MKQRRIKPWQILSFKYRHTIRKLAQPFYKLPSFASIGIGIVLHTGRHSWISTDPKVTVHNTYSGLDRGEILLDYDFLKESRVIFPEEFMNYDLAQNNIDSLKHSLGFFRGYALSHYCDDCCLVINYYAKEKVLNPNKLYCETITTVEAASLDFIDGILPYFLEELPELNATRFATDKNYRHSVITTYKNNKSIHNLNNSEIAILYWTARGKTAQDIAIILSLSKNTIDSYRRSILQKLGVTNISQAVHLAVSAGIVI